MINSTQRFMYIPLFSFYLYLFKIVLKDIIYLPNLNQDCTFNCQGILYFSFFLTISNTVNHIFTVKSWKYILLSKKGNVVHIHLLGLLIRITNCPLNIHSIHLSTGFPECVALLAGFFGISFKRPDIQSTGCFHIRELFLIFLQKDL